MVLVENFEDNGPVRIGIGAEDDATWLYGDGVDFAVAPAEIATIIHLKAFRPGDTLVMVNPRALSKSRLLTLDQISEGEGTFQVVGHDPMRIADADDVAVFYALKAKVGRSAPVREATGRKPGINYSLEDAEAILRFYWHKPNKTPAEVLEFAERRLELEAGTLKIHWVKMLARKYTGTTKREMPLAWAGLSEDG